MAKIAIIALFLSTLGFSKSYIVRLKKSVGVQTTSLKSFLGTSKIKNMRLSFGNFYVIDVNSQTQYEKLKSLKKSEYFISMEADQEVSILPMNTKTVFGGGGGKKKPSKPVYTGPLFDKQWALQNTGDNSKSSKVNQGIAGMDLNALEAWKMIKGDKDIVVAVVDTGIDQNHKDLIPNMWVNEAEKNGKDGVDDDGNGLIDDINGYDFVNNDADPFDDHSHGSHCAGVIGALHDNDGIKGLMDQVKLMSVKTFTKWGSGSMSGILKSIDYAIENGADIISNSWGGSSNPSPAFEAAVKKAEDRGIIFVKAAGNSNEDNDRVANDSNLKNSNVIIVGAHNGMGEKAYFSSFGKNNVHVFAPGTAILSTVPANKFEKMSGTSMATPYVAALAGLIWASEPDLTPEEVRERMMSTSVKSDKLKNYSQSGGRVDAFRALKNLK